MYAAPDAVDASSAAAAALPNGLMLTLRRLLVVPGLV